MPTELSRSREGENQQSDQTSTRRDASPESVYRKTKIADRKLVAY